MEISFEKSQTMTNCSDCALIIFRRDLRDSQAKSYFNQLLIILEQFAKQDNFKTKSIRE